jgi:transcriptional regulator GlxA family with amidase domain
MQSKEADEDNLVGLTAQAKIKTTAGIQDDVVQPGRIDILFIPGPDPAAVHEHETLDFVRGHAEHGTTILTVCTGCFIAAEAGILNKRSASGPRALVPSLRTKYPAVAWDDKRRFVKDIQTRDSGMSHEIWSSGKLARFALTSPFRLTRFRRHYQWLRDGCSISEGEVSRPAE